MEELTGRPQGGVQTMEVVNCNDQDMASLNRYLHARKLWHATKQVAPVKGSPAPLRRS